MPVETDETTYFCLLRRSYFSYGSMFFNSSCSNKMFSFNKQQESKVNLHMYFLNLSHTVPTYNNVQAQSGQFMVASQSHPVQGFEFLTGNTGTYLVQS